MFGSQKSSDSAFPTSENFSPSHDLKFIFYLIFLGKNIEVKFMLIHPRMTWNSLSMIFFAKILVSKVYVYSPAVRFFVLFEAPGCVVAPV